MKERKRRKRDAWDMTTTLTFHFLTNGVSFSLQQKQERKNKPWKTTFCLLWYSCHSTQLVLFPFIFRTRTPVMPQTLPMTIKNTVHLSVSSFLLSLEHSLTFCEGCSLFFSLSTECLYSLPASYRVLELRVGIVQYVQLNEAKRTLLEKRSSVRPYAPRSTMARDAALFCSSRQCTSLHSTPLHSVISVHILFFLAPMVMTCQQRQKQLEMMHVPSPFLSFPFPA